jgi:hypothetical protein
MMPFEYRRETSRGAGAASRYSALQELRNGGTPFEARLRVAASISKTVEELHWKSLEK